MHELPAVYKHLRGDRRILDLRNTGEKETYDTADKQNSVQTLTLPSTGSVTRSLRSIPSTPQLLCGNNINIYNGLSKGLYPQKIHC